MWAPSHPLPDNLRRVSALHLRVGDADDAGRARIAIEDGLASADFGDSGRLIYVRRLALPAFATRFNGPAAARAIESSFRALLPEAVHGVEPHAVSAPMVWFADVLEARLTALSHRVEGEALTAWFWRHIDPSFAHETEPAIGALYAAIEQTNEGAITPLVAMKALARQWRHWSASGFERFLGALRISGSAAGPRLARPDTGSPTPIYKSAVLARALAGGAAARLSLAARVAPARVAWLARWELIAADIMSFDAPVFEQGILANQLLSLAQPRNATLAAPPRVNASDAAATDAMPRPETEARIPPRPATALPSTLALEYSLPPWLADARVSTHGGFFLLINAWRAAGIEPWLEEAAPEWRHAWLERWARRLNLADDDPQRDVWRTPPATLPQDIMEDFARKTRSTRRWLRTLGRIGPASVVLRNAAVSITRTHLDVVFATNAVDLRIRRIGLDQDPGWVPWLGRIVTFHYVDRRPAS